MAANRENRNKALFAERVVEDFKLKITGGAEERVVGKNPEDKFLVGKLSTIEAHTDLQSSKVSINQIGVDFMVREEEIEDITLEITPRGTFYYRVNPTLEEQKEEIRKAYQSNTENAEGEPGFQMILKNYMNGLSEQGYESDIAPVYEKVQLDEEFKVSIKLADIYDKENKVGIEEIKAPFIKIFDHRIDELQRQDRFYKNIRKKISIKDLVDEGAWNEFLQQGKVPVLPRWSIYVLTEIKYYSKGLCRVSVYVANDTKGSDSEGIEKKKNKSNLINTMFDAGMTVKLIGADYQPIKLDYFEDNYKYDKEEKVIGNNCSIEYLDDNTIVTSNIPIYIQKKLKTRDDIKVRFKDLQSSPLATLNKVLTMMEEELRNLEKDFEERKASGELHTARSQEQFSSEVKGFKFEVERFKNGIEKIESYSFIKQAFILMNEAFANTSKGYDTWRLFQIVFIVSLIPDIGVSEYGETAMGDKCKIDEVDVLYFPTGGGKTEAFLGVTIFTLFFDRIRGKKAGVSSIIKYPLRLLSVQQVQRVADILGAAELIRQDKVKIGESFSLGYYVGDVNTPNSLDQDRISGIKQQTQEVLNENYKILDKCPFCKGDKINIVLDEDKIRLKHICENSDCPSKGEIPLYIVDREIYRYLPTVIISTIDKIAAIGYQANFKNILGQVMYKCPRHGYTSKLTCTEKELCKENVMEFEVASIKDPEPTLVIQDELHLVRESLGTFDGHYETFFQYMLEMFSQTNKKVKIIGATATISSYKFQLRHLYAKDGVRFPSESPSIKRNFYSFIDEEEIHRFIVGYAPYGKAIINSVVYSMMYLKEVVWRYKEAPEDILSIQGIDLESKEEALKLLEDYWFLLEYNNVKQDGNKVLMAIDTPINVELKAAGIQPFEYRKMTGDDTFQDVRKVLAEVEGTKNVFEAFNLIAATSMISHGVDADRFNQILFFGMPGNTAEYIQAYSRAGRKYPGIVIVILRPTRDKDISYLKHFKKFHECKDILVDPVPINRWATRAVEKTFPGILQGLILNYFEQRLQDKKYNLYMAKNVKEALEQGDIPKEELTMHILRAYGCTYEDDLINDLGRQYKEVIEQKVDKFYFDMLSKSYEKKAFFSNELENIFGERVMKSLRDSEEQVKIKLD